MPFALRKLGRGDRGQVVTETQGSWWLQSCRTSPQPPLHSRLSSSYVFSLCLTAATMGPLIWPRWSPTILSPILGNRRCPWAPGGAVWVLQRFTGFFMLLGGTMGPRA